MTDQSDNTHPAATGSVRELPTDRYGETALDRISDHAENGTMPPQFREDLRALLALAAAAPTPDAAAEESQRLREARQAGFNKGWKERGLHEAATAAAPKVASDTALPNSWVNTPEAEREQAMLLAEVELHLQQCRVFITTREKMHPCGVELHDELLAKVTAALDAIGREKAHG